jgi:nucleoside-triphosphatase THEP1
MPLIDPTQAFIKEKLASHTAAKYEHTDQSKSICADDTRVELLDNIKRWLLSQPSNAELIFWVTGIPGSGKSTLSATIVEDLRKNNTPVSAQFFISRNIPETTDPKKIIPTIAQQLAISSPTAARVLEMALKNGYPGTRYEQVTSLLLDPIRELSNSRDVVVILIDALDELENPAKNVIEILSHIAPIDCDLPNNIRFVITSRPEHWADISTSKKLKHAVFKQYSLATELSVTEVHNFVVARTKEIVDKRMELTPNEPDWHDWPDPDQLQSLSNKANGLFHYAATALHWIEQRVDEDGTACRGSAFKRFSEDGLDELEDLYKLILTSWEDVYKPAKDNDRRATRLGGFQHVMGTILVLRKPLLIREIVALLSDIPKDKFDVTNFLQQMRSVLIPGTSTSFYNATPQMHKSFRDYTMSERAPPGFRILTGDAQFKLARSCLDIIVKAGSQRGIDYEYAVTHWYGHLQRAVLEGARCDDERMWTLLGEMVNERVVGVWMGKGRLWKGSRELIDIFESVARTGWQLLEVRRKHGERNLTDELYGSKIRMGEGWSR